jgi:DNA-binding beta-propeller fold protein YncE
MRRIVFLVIILSLVTPQLSSAEVTSDQTKLTLLKTITGDISPKSLRSSGTGLVSAHNMMYRHSVTIYDANTQALIKRIPDSVKLSDFGFSKYSGTYKGSPVEGSFSPDGKYLYVTNYAMYGKGFNKEGTDICSPANGFDSSFVYRINLSTYKIDGVYAVGSVPKVIEVTPDNKYILVTTWCSYTLDVISVEKQKRVKSLKIGRYPRGIAVSADSSKAYIAEMGGSNIHVVNLSDFSKKLIPIGVNPRAVVLSPDNTKMYVTLNMAGKVAAWDLVNNKSLGSVKTGDAARSLAVSSDGTALFVVNYKSGTMSKVRSSDLKILQTIKVCAEPIGVTYDAPTSRTWVACYGGSIKVLDNR